MNCNRDQNCFKDLVSSWMAFTTYLVPDTASKIIPKLQASGKAAALSCTGGSDGQQCNVRWWQTGWDNTYGTEQEASVLSIISVQLLGITGRAPVTASTGGTSKSDPGAAGNLDGDTTIILAPITTKDRVGAGIITALVLASVVFGSAWLVWP